ncbi:hypothetical protein HJFPF1_13565 [Paramyrothecium foliicola]|nr:hypothetical protein HJFPF1_13565 [Paramyrothecium foliicola]
MAPKNWIPGVVLGITVAFVVLNWLYCTRTSLRIIHFSRFSPYFQGRLLAEEGTHLPDKVNDRLLSAIEPAEQQSSAASKFPIGVSAGAHLRLEEPDFAAL